MPKKCSICCRDDRADIENAILNMTSAATPKERTSIEDIAKQFDLTSKDSFDDLKMHALFHMPLVTKYDLEAADSAAEKILDQIGSGATLPNLSDVPNSSVEPIEGRMSMSKKLKLLEADVLTSVNNEYLVTLKAVGRRVNKLAQVSSIDEEDADKQLWCAKLMTKPIVDLYLGLGAEIRKNVATITDIDRAVNGPQDSTTSGLAALASAIRDSGQKNKEDE